MYRLTNNTLIRGCCIYGALVEINLGGCNCIYAFAELNPLRWWYATYRDAIHKNGQKSNATKEWNLYSAMWDKIDICGLCCSYNATDLSTPLCVFATTYTRDGRYQGHSFENDIKQIAMYSIFDADSLYYLGRINYIEDLYSKALHYRIATV